MNQSNFYQWLDRFFWRKWAS